MTNPFQTYIQPSMENDQGPMTTEVEDKVEQALNADAPDLAITDEVADDATKALNEADEKTDNAVKTAEVVTAALASLESLYDTLATVSQERDTLTDTEVSFMRIALAGTAKSLGGTVTQLVPSLESDNFFERNDVVASMESIGSAIKAGVKAAYEAFKKLIVKLKEWFTNAKVKLASIKARFTKAKDMVVDDEQYTLTYPSLMAASGPDSALKDLQARVKALKEDYYTDGNTSNLGDVEARTVDTKEADIKGSDARQIFQDAVKLLTELDAVDYLSKLDIVEKSHLKDLKRSIEHQKELEMDTTRAEKFHDTMVKEYKSARREYHYIVNAILQFKLAKVK